MNLKKLSKLGLAVAVLVAVGLAVMPKAKVADAQARLKNGEKAYFELLSGAPASYPMTRTAPRDAFLNLPLANTFSVERKATDNKLWQPYRIIVLPDGPGKLLWDVEVVLGINGQIERIAMLYRPPAPF